MTVTDDVVGVVVPVELILPVKETFAGGRAGTIFLSGGKILLIPTDGGAFETVTSA